MLRIYTFLLSLDIPKFPSPCWLIEVKPLPATLRLKEGKGRVAIMDLLVDGGGGPSNDSKKHGVLYSFFFHA
jgi:hypothetical protein